MFHAETSITEPYAALPSHTDHGGFGTVAVGDAADSSFDVSNTGNISLTITKARPQPERAPSSAPLNEGLVINLDQHTTAPITFTPAFTGPPIDRHRSADHSHHRPATHHVMWA